VNATHVLDPTLLLTQDDYTLLCTNIAQRPPFVFAYILDNSAVKESEIRNFAALHKLPLILIHAETNLSKDDSIEKWLSYFRDAEYVITDSFHGTIFSINFKRDFWVYGNPERGNARFTSILESLNLCDRLVSTIPTNDESIDWSNVNTLLLKYRKESYNWLMQKLS
jgi:exopolysaccharide biosynthesis predicted pyruvyltransferase EpsI